jgi:hypothetical protein
VDLKWWPVIVIGLVCLAAAIAAAALLPMARMRRVLRPLANVERLTGLPEYARVYRVYFFSVIVTGVLLVTTFVTALTASARPTGMSSSVQAFDTAHPEDIMLCVGEPVGDPTTAGFLNYYADYSRQLNSSDTQRIGLTSTTLRVIPLTRDYRYVADRLKSLARLARIQQDLDDRKPVSDADRADLKVGIEEFSRPLSYVDYVPSVDDLLALCLTGFPSYQARSGHRRQLVYLGYSTLRDAADQRKSLFTDSSVKQMADQAGVQINVIARSDVAASSTRDNDSLRATTAGTGGKFFLYNPAGTPVTDNGTDPTLSHNLDQIRANAPTAQLPGGMVITSRSWDSPEALLIASIAAAALLSLCLAVLRR